MLRFAASMSSGSVRASRSVAARITHAAERRAAEAATAGATVREGQELGRLTNLDVRKEIMELTGQRDQQRAVAEASGQSQVLRVAGDAQELEVELQPRDDGARLGHRSGVRQHTLLLEVLSYALISKLEEAGRLVVPSKAPRPILGSEKPSSTSW